LQQEKDLSINGISPLDLFGPNDSRMRALREAFPKLKLIPRGNTLKVMGEPAEIEKFEDLFNRLLQHYERYNVLTDTDIVQLAGPGGEVLHPASADEILVFGNNGLMVKARTANQRRMVAGMQQCDMLFAIGPAGTGKTYTAVALAVRALKNKEVRRIILTRPAVEAGENLGFLPGDLKEKLDPYMQPLYDALRDMIPHDRLNEYLEQGIIQIAPMAFMRGRTLDNAFVILDEAQNATRAQIKMFLTRMGQSARFIITGDPSQVDLPLKQPSGLKEALTLLKDVEGITIIRLNESDVIRHKLVRQIIEAFDKATKEHESRPS
jgi:phosphate starvation-inducible PhoH-like protein